MQSNRYAISDQYLFVTCDNTKKIKTPLTHILYYSHTYIHAVLYSEKHLICPPSLNINVLSKKCSK